ncbi:hypothetical protein [Streptomyces lydicus]|uniref:hypothetical protein n=1 Tax=Streptomyces lydicus TaxID=47763 RepID=UPI00101206AF|nr:hypothetical protein [Streptomyces lydicus]MCZ1012068.1 hypothetical protein [Streptomyces lydicus]
MRFDDRGSPARRLAHEAALALLESACLASTIAAATASGTAVHRRTSSRHGGHISRAASVAAALTSGILTSGLLDLATEGTRRWLNGIDRNPAKSQPADNARSSSAEEDAVLSDAEVLRRLERDVAIDAAYRAATAAWCHTHRDVRDDSEDSFLTSRGRWKGHPDGTASLALMVGRTLHFEPVITEAGDWCRPDFILDNNGTRIEVATPADLLAHLTGLHELSEPDPADPYDEFGTDVGSGA